MCLSTKKNVSQFVRHRVPEERGFRTAYCVCHGGYAITKHRRIRGAIFSRNRETERLAADEPADRPRCYPEHHGSAAVSKTVR